MIAARSDATSRVGNNAPRPPDPPKACEIALAAEAPCAAGSADARFDPPVAP